MPNLVLTVHEVDILIELLRSHLKEIYNDENDQEIRRKNLFQGNVPQNTKEEIADILGKLEYVGKWHYKIEKLEMKLDMLRCLSQKIISSR